mgnify:CR=1 FL=1
MASDGNDTVCPLFLRFVEEAIQEKGLSLADVGRQRKVLKRQLSTWEDFPRADYTATLEFSQKTIYYASAQVEIFSYQNPKRSLSQKLTFFELDYPSIPIRFSDDGKTLYLGTKSLSLGDLDQTFGITVNYELGPLPYNAHTFSITRGKIGRAHV